MMTREQRLAIRQRISSDCCKHYCGTMIYHIGYMHGLRCCKVAVCEDCGHVHNISGLWGSFLLRLLRPWCTGMVDIIDEIIIF